MIFNTLLEVIKMQIKFYILKGGRTLTLLHRERERKSVREQREQREQQQ